MVKKNPIVLLLVSSLLFAQNEFCENPQSFNFRVLYGIGDTISIEDQLKPYEICFASEDVVADTFRLADNNGNLNGGDYKITLISMNASW